MKRAIVYCDGASRKDGRGGWGATILFDKWWYDVSGGEYNTTNNRMELMAAIEALNWLPEACEVVVYSDSQYVIKGITEYLVTWKFCGWRTGTNQPVKNKDLWVELERIAGRHSVDWQWVRGHAGVEGNERADKLAGDGIPPIRGDGGGYYDATGNGKGVAERLQRSICGEGRDSQPLPAKSNRSHSLAKRMAKRGRGDRGGQ